MALPPELLYGGLECIGAESGANVITSVPFYASSLGGAKRGRNKAVYHGAGQETSEKNSGSK